MPPHDLALPPHNEWGMRGSAILRVGSGARRGAGLEETRDRANILAAVGGVKGRDFVRSRGRKRRWRRNYQCRQKREGCADVTIVVTEAMVFRISRDAATLIGIDSCLDIGRWCQVLGVNMAEGQCELERQRQQSEPASEPQSFTSPCHEDRYQSGQIGPHDEIILLYPRWVTSSNLAVK